MMCVGLLQKQAETAFRDLCRSFEGVDEPLSWAVVPLKEGEYLNSNGSILTMVQHVAGCKRMYGSIAFRGAELRWSGCADHYEAVGANWSRSVEDLRQAHEYWMGTWAHLQEEQLEQEVEHFSGQTWPVWRIITTVIHHDQYHAGQIEILKSSLQPSDLTPPSTAEDIRQYCSDLPHW